MCENCYFDQFDDFTSDELAEQLAGAMVEDGEFDFLWDIY